MWWKYNNLIRLIDKDLDMPNHYDKDCTCVDPLRPGEKMYQCGTKICHDISEFWHNHLSRVRGTVILVDEEDIAKKDN